MASGPLGLHPALNAFLQNMYAARENNRIQQQTEFENARKTKSDELEQQGFDLRTKQINEAIKMDQERFKLEQSRAQLDRQAKQLAARQIVSELARRGNKPNDYSQAAIDQTAQPVQQGPDGRLPGVAQPDVYNYDGFKFGVNEIPNAQEQGQADYDVAAPLTQLRSEEQQKLYNSQAAARMSQAMAQQIMRNRAAEEQRKFTAVENEKNRTSNEKRTNSTNATRLTAANISASAAQKRVETKGAINKPRKLSASQEDKLINLDLMEDSLVEALELGKKLNWSPHVAFIGNIKGKLDSKRGIDSSDQAKYKTLLGDVLGKKAIEQGGKSFTKTEKDLLMMSATDLSETGNTPPTKMRQQIKNITKLKAAYGRPSNIKMIGDSIYRKVEGGWQEIE